jgi:hypothetical protein
VARGGAHILVSKARAGQRGRARTRDGGGRSHPRRRRGRSEPRRSTPRGAAPSAPRSASSPRPGRGT